MRIVSLLASATEMVNDLGAGEWLAGRSHECDHPAWVRRLPQCSEPAFDIQVSSRDIDCEVTRRVRSGEPLYTIHYDRIRELHPDIIFAQEHCEVCAVTPGDVRRGRCEFPGTRIVALTASTVDQIFQSLFEIARAIGLEERAAAVAAAHREKIEGLQSRTARRRRPTVAVLEWVDPIFAMGNWVPELVEIAGGLPVLGSPGEYSRAIDPRLLLDANPEYLVIAPCGFDLERALAEQQVLEQLPWWHKLRAVEEGKVAFADGNRYFNRSSLSVVATAEILAEILHGIEAPASAEKPRWRWYTDPRVRVL